MSWWGRRILILGVCALAWGAALIDGTLAAADQPVFPVMNTSEEPPDGVWFRYGPDPGQTTHTTGLGVYMGEHVRVKCYWVGTAFGPYANRIWYYAYDVERPRVGGAPNEGWINTHYVDDSMTANHANPSVSHCASGSGDGGGGESEVLPQGPIAQVSIYYSPFAAGRYELADHSVKTAYINQYATHCKNPHPSYEIASSLASGHPIASLAGWSAGRIGVISFLRLATDSQLKQLNYIILIDPGSFGELDCDRKLGAGDQLARWLAVNQSAHLVVISGSNVSQLDNSKGIQEIYYNAIRRQSRPPRLNLRPRVLTCNYSITHPNAFLTAQYWIKHQIGSSTRSCPWLSDGQRTYHPSAGWNP